VTPGEDLEAPASVSLQRRIEWIDTDAAGIYHWTAVFRLAEAAEAVMHTALGITELTFGRVPRVAVAVEFRRPLHFNDQVEVELAVERLGRASLSYRLAITGPEGPAAEGRLTVCCIDPDSGQAAPWPAEVRRALAAGGRVEVSG
jgi:acyl-CoA thioester hydrolase